MLTPDFTAVTVAEKAERLLTAQTFGAVFGEEGRSALLITDA